MKNKPPVFIVGTPRSGTTLTAKIIGTHSQIYMPGEVHYFDDIYSARDQIGDLSEAGAMRALSDKLFTIYGRYNEKEDQEIITKLLGKAVSLERYLSGCHNYCEILEKFMRLQSDHFGKQRWGNNAPRDIFNVKEIISCYPSVKFVVCVRDIRAFLLSYQGKWRNTSDEHVDRLKKLYHPVVTSYLWKSSMRQLDIIKAVVPKDNYVVIRYEDLVTEPEKTVRNICNVIGEEFEVSMLDVVESNSSHQNATKGIFTSSVNKWRESLSQEEISISQSIAEKEITNLNYEVINTRVNRLKLLYLYLSTPYYLFRALLANRHQTGPIIPYLFRRVRSLLIPGR